MASSLGNIEIAKLLLSNPQIDVNIASIQIDVILIQFEKKINNLI